MTISRVGRNFVVTPVLRTLHHDMVDGGIGDDRDTLGWRKETMSMTVSFEEALFYRYFRASFSDQTIVLCDRSQLCDSHEIGLWLPGRGICHRGWVAIRAWSHSQQGHRQTVGRNRRSSGCV